MQARQLRPAQGQGRVALGGNGSGHRRCGGETGQCGPVLISSAGGHQNHPLAVQSGGSGNEVGHRLAGRSAHYGDPLPPGGGCGGHAVPQILLVGLGGAVAHHHAHVLLPLQNRKSGLIVGAGGDGDRRHRSRPVEEDHPDQLGHVLAAGAAEGGHRLLIAGDGVDRLGGGLGVYRHQSHGLSPAASADQG